MQQTDYRLRFWHLAAIAAAATAVGLTAVQVQRERYAKAKRLGVSIAALSNPDRMMSRLRAGGAL